MASFGKCVITSGTLNIRGTDSASGTVVGTLVRDEVVTLLTTTPSAANMYKMQRGTLTGYVSAATNHMQIISITGSTGTVNASSLYVRSGPATTYTQLGSLTSGASVIVIATATNGWKLISNTAQTVCGWCDGTFITGGGSGGSGPNAGVTIAKVLNGEAAFVYDSTNTPNEDLKTVQTYLAALTCTATGSKYYTGVIDGKFGSGMVTSVRNFQLENDAEVGSPDEKVGKKTLSNLITAYNDRTNYNAYGSEVSASYLMGTQIDDTSLLARLIYGENTVNKQAQANIAYVVWARLTDTTRDFKNRNTWKAVAQQDGAWNVIWKGHINARKPPRTNEFWQNALRLAKILVANSNMPTALGSTCTKLQLFAVATDSLGSGKKDVVSIGGTSCYNN